MGAGSIQVVKRKECGTEMRPTCVCSRAAFAIFLGKVNEPTDSLEPFLTLALRRTVVLRRCESAAEDTERCAANARLRYEQRNFDAGHGGEFRGEFFDCSARPSRSDPDHFWTGGRPSRRLEIAES